MTTRANKYLYGLVLAGGKSSRMGEDKGLIEYHQGQPQRMYIYNLLSSLCEKAFFGLRLDQKTEAGELPLIIDNENYQGPFKCLHAAHDAHPLQAWLVVACDLPFITEDTLRKLIRERDRTKVATAYYQPEQDYPEPLVAIWEPEGLRLAKIYASSGNNSPARFLKGANYKKVTPDKKEELMNVNRPEDFEQAKAQIRGLD